MTRKRDTHIGLDICVRVVISWNALGTTASLIFETAGEDASCILRYMD